MPRFGDYLKLENEEQFKMADYDLRWHLNGNVKPREVDCFDLGLDGLLNVDYDYIVPYRIFRIDAYNWKTTGTFYLNLAGGQKVYFRARSTYGSYDVYVRGKDNKLVEQFAVSEGTFQDNPNKYTLAHVTNGTDDFIGLVHCPFNSHPEGGYVDHVNFPKDIHFWEGSTIKKKPIAPEPIEEDEGGKGDFDNDSDIIGIPTKPVVSLGTKYLTQYAVLNPWVDQFADYIFNLNFLDTLFSNPIDGVVGLKMFPFRLPWSSYPLRDMYLLNHNSGIKGYRLKERFFDITCGSINVKEYFGNALDYSPNTPPIKIYLPYIGYRSLDTDLVMQSTLTLTYLVDLLTGACVANIHIGKINNKVDFRGNIYSFQGNMACDIPLSAQDNSNITNALITGGIGIGSAIARGSIGGALTSALNTATAKNTVNNDMNSQGIQGFLAPQTPFLLIERPSEAYPKNYEHYAGYPLNQTKTLTPDMGFTKVEEVFLNDFECTVDELQEIKSLLKEGVIL